MINKEKNQTVSFIDLKNRDLLNKNITTKNNSTFLQVDVIKLSMKTYYVKCRKNTQNLNSKIFKIKNGRLTMHQNILSAELKSQDLWNNKKQKYY